MDRRSCILCNSFSKKKFVFSGYHIYECPDCECRFVLPQSDNRLIHDLEFIKAKEKYFFASDHAIDDSAELKEFIRGYLSKGRKKILDIGCGSGIFINKFADSHDVMGIELSSDYGPILLERGVPFKIGDIRGMGASLGIFDLITLWDVFEHLPSPREYLRSILEHLENDGFLIIWTNNYRESFSLFAELTYRASCGYYKQIMEKSFNRESGHNFNFTKKTLEGIFKSIAGLKRVSWGYSDTNALRVTEPGLTRLFYRELAAVNRFIKRGKIIWYVLQKSNK
jgi:SAM-dependent methyltransferase